MSKKPSAIQLLETFQHHRERMKAELAKRIVGQDEVVDQVIAAIFSRGHCLLVGVPGLAKTLLVRAVADIMTLSFRRIQFTPDLMPSDITGTNVLEETPEGQRDFRFVPGPLFAHIVLADEINRAPPKTQSALLEAMQERQVTVGQQTYDLPRPFFVIATQNPIEQEGTYPLPEAQLDRFMFNIHVDYPTVDEEEKILAVTTSGKEETTETVMSARDILSMQRLIQEIAVPAYVIKYVTSLVRATRPKDITAPSFTKELVDWGAGPRAGQYLIMGAKVFAAANGRVNVSCNDVRKVAVPVLRHRIAANFQAQAQGVTSVDIVHKLLDSVKEPQIPKHE